MFETLTSAEGAMVLLKLTLWCVLLFASKPLLRRTAASTRHWLLTLSLAGTLALPLLLWWAPTWPIPSNLLLPRPAPVLRVAVETSTVPAEPASDVSAVASSFARQGELSAAPSGWSSADDLTALPRLSTEVATTPVGGSLAPAEGWQGLAWPNATWLIWIWLTGVAALLLRTARSALQVSRIVREAVSVTEPRAVAAMARASQRLGSNLPPTLLESDRLPVPFAWRAIASAVVLPSSWRDWDDDRLAVVLIHELAHLRRRDAVALWIGRAATALWWFHPLVWLLDAWARQECEQAADDAVLLSGSRASAYAEHLIAISRALTRPFPSGVALMMSNSPDLKHRLLAILHADRPRRTLTGGLVAGTSCLALAFAVVLAGVRFAPVVEAQEQDSDVEWAGEWDSDSDLDSSAGSREWQRAYQAYNDGRYDEAIGAFEAAAAAGFRPAISSYNAACSMALAGRSDEALATLERAIDLGFDKAELIAEDSDLDPLRSDTRFQAMLDDAFESMGERRDPIDHYRYRNAQEAFEVLRDSGSEDAGAWAKVGYNLMMLRELDLAAEALEYAARYGSDASSTALYNLACAYALDGHSGAALETLGRAIESGFDDSSHMRRDPDLRSLRGDAEFERLAELAEDLDLDRYRAGVPRRRGRNNDYSAEMWAPAIDFYRGFVEDNPNLGAGWFNLAYALHYSERFDESVEMFRRAVDLGFRPATSAYNMACGYSMLGQVDNAIPALEEAVDLGFEGNFDRDSDLANLRADPRFREIRMRLKLDRNRDWS